MKKYLNNIKELNITFNKFMDSKYSTDKIFLKSYSLTSLNIDMLFNFKVKTYNINIILENLKNSLIELSIQDFTLKNRHIKDIIFPSFKHLKTITVSAVKFKSGSMNCLFEKFCYLAKNLREINIENCGLDEFNSLCVTYFLSRCENLEHINFSKNQDLGEGVILIMVNTLMSLNTIESINLEYCRIEDHHLKAIQRPIAFFKKLEYLNLNFNPITGPAIFELFYYMKEFSKNIKTILLINCHLNDIMKQQVQLTGKTIPSLQKLLTEFPIP